MFWRLDGRPRSGEAPWCRRGKASAESQLEAVAWEAGGGLTRGRTACDCFGGAFLTFSGWA